MGNVKILGKFLDQPILVSKFQKVVPALLVGGATAYTLHDAKKAPKGQRKERAIKTGTTLGVTVASALAAPYIASAITKRKLPESINIIKQRNGEIVDTFIKSNNVSSSTKEILNKGTDKILSFKEVKTLFNEVKDKKFLEKLIPSPENVTAKEIFSEIGYLSTYGAVPVVGGITGGIIADKITDKKNWKKNVPDKIKEGSYQYLANIFMCNVGAGLALACLERLGITSKVARAVGMTAGIILTGVIGGSKIANLIGNKFIDPICCKKKNERENKKERTSDILDINFMGKNHSDYIDTCKCNCNGKNSKKNDRTPELLDIGLHTDDIATVSLLSGLKWIEPALPAMYTISGYRAGIGYRN